MRSLSGARKALARLLRRLADWLDRPVLVPMEFPPPSAEEVISVSPAVARHALERWERGEWRVVRSYKKGAAARDAILAKERSKTPGSWRFTTDGIPRHVVYNPE